MSAATKVKVVVELYSDAGGLESERTIIQGLIPQDYDQMRTITQLVSTRLGDVLSNYTRVID